MKDVIGSGLFPPDIKTYVKVIKSIVKTIGYQTAQWTRTE